jgi:F-type H+-transporting ATPase subunit epsilon
MVAPLAIGVVRLTAPGSKDQELVAVSGGFLEVRPDKVTILAQAAEKAEDIDVERALRAKERAEQRMKEQKVEDIDFRRAELALQRAMNRLTVTGRQ